MLLPLLLVVPLFVVLAGVLLLWYGRRSRKQSGVPAGEVVYSDTGAWETVERSLVSRRYGLVGKPDYLVRVVERGREMTIPVEVKSRARPRVPYDSHILQLAAYCLLVEETYQVRPAYGLLHYADATIKCPFTDAVRMRVIETIKEIGQAYGAGDVHRQHDDAARCRNCGYRHACGEELV